MSYLNVKNLREYYKIIVEDSSRSFYCLSWDALAGCLTTELAASGDLGESSRGGTEADYFLED